MDVVTDSSSTPWIVSVTQSVKRSDSLVNGYYITQLPMKTTWDKIENGGKTFKFSSSNGNPHSQATPLAMHIYDTTAAPMKMYILFHHDGSYSSWVYRFVGDGSNDKVVK